MSRTQLSTLWGIVLAMGGGQGGCPVLAQPAEGRSQTPSPPTGRRSLLEQTLARVARLLPPSRVLIFVPAVHQQAIARPLAHWPPHNIIRQPTNRGTAPGILLPLAHILHRERLPTVAIFPTTSFHLEEDQFTTGVTQAVVAAQVNRHECIVLRVPPNQGAGGPRGIESAQGCGECQTPAQFTRDVEWATVACVAQTATVWEMSRQVAPDLSRDFTAIRQALGKSTCRSADCVCV